MDLEPTRDELLARPEVILQTIRTTVGADGYSGSCQRGASQRHLRKFAPERCVFRPGAHHCDGHRLVAVRAITANSGSVSEAAVPEPRSWTSAPVQLPACRRYSAINWPWPVSPSVCQIATALVGKQRLEKVIASTPPGRSTRARSRRTSTGCVRYWI